MELVGTWRSLYTLRYMPVTFIQVVFSAGTIFLLSAVQASAGSRFAKVSFSHSLTQAELCIQYLLESGKSFQCATHIAEILRNLLVRELKSRVMEKAAMPNPSYHVWDSSSSSSNESSNDVRLFNVGLHMMGGETLSDPHFVPNGAPGPNQFEGDHLERQLGVFADEDAQMPLELTDEDFAALLQALNQQYPSIPMPSMN
jgi:hypothetical protein